MIRLLRGRFGHNLLRRGEIVTLDFDYEAELVKRGIANYVNETDSETSTTYLSEFQLEKIKSKKKLMDYAESIGLLTLDEGTTLKQMVEMILDYQEENKEGFLVESEGNV